MILRFDESQINSIAGRYDCPQEELDIMQLRDTILSRKYLNKTQLRQLAKWKSKRSAGYIDNNASDYVKEITKFAFSTDNERSRIEVLTTLDGVGWPTASAILHLFHKDQYPILDFRALWSASIEVPIQYKLSFWQPYVQFCRMVAKNNNVSMRILDRAMWQYSFENQ